MEIDITTLADLSIFNHEEVFSVFNKLNFCNTVGGKEQLRQNLNQPLATLNDIEGVQQTIKVILQNEQYWPIKINNGSVMVIEKFYVTSIDEIPANLSAVSAYSYKVLHAPDFSLVKYSAEHFFNFIKGMQQFVQYFFNENAPFPLHKILSRTKQILNKEQFTIVEKNKAINDISLAEQLHLTHFLRYTYKQNVFELLEIYFQLDAWYGMAQAVKKYELVFPEFVKGSEPLIQCTGLYHILLANPVAYDVELNPASNFLFLTGANMAGKSTFIKSVGTAVFLAHVGMGVPAQEMRVSLFDGLLSNINVVDNIAKGESYFYNEVQRIKSTITKINDGRKWLILIDELFKGTNVQDAMKCSSTVIEGLLKIKNSLFILSTHLYEIGDELKQYPNISFNYFETAVVNDQLQFSYQLKQGISNDRLGYLILKREGVVDMLNGIKSENSD